MSRVGARDGRRIGKKGSRTRCVQKYKRTQDQIAEAFRNRRIYA